jgi:hypothetical protein
VYAYLAGIVDADGTITCPRVSATESFPVAIAVHQAEREAVDLFAATFGGEVTMRDSYSPLATRETYLWTASAGNRVEVLRRLLPHLRQKRRQAEIALEICRLNASWRKPGRGLRRPKSITRKLRAEQTKLRRANDFGKRAQNARVPKPPKVLVEKVPRTVAAYLAGVLDADGHLRARRQIIHGYRRYPVEVKLKQVTPDSIQVLQRYFGIKVGVESPSVEGGRHLLNWACAARTAERLLATVEPYMLIKKERAKLLLECVRLNSIPRQPLTVPKVVPGEPLLPLAKAAKLAGVSYAGAAAAAVREGRAPGVRKARGRRGESSVFVPASFIPEWRTRDHRKRPDEHYARLDALVARCRKLNSRK